MTPSYNKTYSLNYISSLLMNLTKLISYLTNQWVAKRKYLYTFNDKVDYFNIRHNNFNEATTKTKALWFLLLMGIPIMLVTDYAGVQSFFEYLGNKISGSLGTFLKNFGFIFFFILEIFIGSILLRLKSMRQQGIASTLGFLLSLILMAIVIVLPSVLIYIGYSFEAQATAKLATKAVTLIGISLVIHAAIFLLIDTVIDSLIYFFYYLPYRGFLNKANPTEDLSKIRQTLKEKYLEFDSWVREIKKHPGDAQAYLPTIGKIENWLRDKIESTLSDEDIDLDELSAQLNNSPVVTEAEKPVKASDFPVANNNHKDSNIVANSEA